MEQEFIIVNLIKASNGVFDISLDPKSCEVLSNYIEKLKRYNNELYGKFESIAEENERLNKEHEAIKKYIHNHTITYIENGIECCKPDKYFNISWVEDMLDGNFENLEILFEDSDLS